MSESISKNNELENEMTLDMSYFWYSDAPLLKTLGLWSLPVSALSHTAKGLLSSMLHVVGQENWQRNS